MSRKTYTHFDKHGNMITIEDSEHVKVFDSYWKARMYWLWAWIKCFYQKCSR